MSVAVRRAEAGDLDRLVPLFDGYRQFYRQPSDPDGARQFLGERLENGDSTILIAEDAGRAVGFVQLYPSFSSVAMRPIFVLNDLYVDRAARGAGVGGALLDAAVDYGRTNGAKSLTLQTEHTNDHAQTVYGAKGWVTDDTFRTYHYPLDA